MNLSILGLYLLGVVLRVFLPYVQEWSQDKSLHFDWRFLIGQVVGAFVGGGLAAVLSETFSTIPEITWLIYAWFSADIGRLGQKVIETRLKGRKADPPIQ